MFIAAGAFHNTKISDLMPELLGRLPIRVNLDPMDLNTMVKILSDTVNSPVKQYIYLLKSDGLNVTVDNEAIKEMAKVANDINERCYSMGARTLDAVVTKVFSKIAFNAYNQNLSKFRMDAPYVKAITKSILDKYKLDSSNQRN